MADWFNKGLKSIKSTVTGEEQDEGGVKSFWESLDESVTLSRTQRIYGFALCAGIGLFFYILAFVFLAATMKFAVLYTLGSLMFFGSTFFLMGPMRQLKSLFQKHRIVAVLVYVLALILTLVVGFRMSGVGGIILILICMALQFVGLVWYILTYIPYGQQAAGSMIASVMT